MNNLKIKYVSLLVMLLACQVGTAQNAKVAFVDSFNLRFADDSKIIQNAIDAFGPIQDIKYSEYPGMYGWEVYFEFKDVEMQMSSDDQKIDFNKLYFNALEVKRNGSTATLDQKKFTIGKPCTHSGYFEVNQNGTEYVYRIANWYYLVVYMNEKGLVESFIATVEG